MPNPIQIDVQVTGAQQGAGVFASLAAALEKLGTIVQGLTAVTAQSVVRMEGMTTALAEMATRSAAVVAPVEAVAVALDKVGVKAAEAAKREADLDAMMARVTVHGLEEAAALNSVAAATDKVTVATGRLKDRRGGLATDPLAFINGAAAAENALQADAHMTAYKLHLQQVADHADRAGGKVKGLAGGMEGLRGLLTRLPNIAGVLGLDDLVAVAWNLERISGLVGGITAATGLAVGGAALAAVPVIYDIVKMLEVFRLNRESVEMTKGATSLSADSMERRILQRAGSGEIDRDTEKALLKEIQELRAAQKAAIKMRPANDAEKAMLVRQLAAGGMGGARPEAPNFEVPVETEARKAERLLEATALLNAKVEAATHASHATLEAGKLAHVAAMAAIDQAAARGEMQTATLAMEGVLKSRTSSQAQQFEALNRWNAAMIEAIQRQADDEEDILDERERQRQANERLIGNDKDALQKSQNDAAAIENARTLLHARTLAQIEAQEAQTANRIANTHEQLTRRLAEQERQRIANAKAASDLEISGIEQDSDLSRQKRVAGLGAAYSKRLAGISTDRQGAQLGAISNDPAVRLRAENELIALKREELEVNTKIHRLAADNSFVGRMRSNIRQLSDAWSNLGANIADVFTNTVQGAMVNVGQSVSDMVFHIGNAGQAWTNLGRQAVASLVQMVAQYIAGKLAMMAVDSIYHAKSTADAVSTTATSGAAGAAKAGEQGGWVGVLIYMGVFVAAIAAVMAIAQGISGGFAEGGMVRGPGSGTSDSIATRLSNGEHVTRAASVSNLGEQFMSRINAGVVDLSALNPGASVVGGGSVQGGTGGGAATGGGTVTNFHFGFHSDESTTMAHLDTVRGRKFLVNASKQTVREVNGKA